VVHAVFLQLLEKAKVITYNRSGAGTLFSPGIELLSLQDLLGRQPSL